MVENIVIIAAVTKTTTNETIPFTTNTFTPTGRIDTPFHPGGLFAH